MKTFWSFLAVFLIVDAWMYSTGHNSFIWANEPQISQWVQRVVHHIGERAQQQEQEQRQ
jgi:hypothetical protein